MLYLRKEKSAWDVVFLLIRVDFDERLIVYVVTIKINVRHTCWILSVHMRKHV
jgi:hypothetical protein